MAGFVNSGWSRVLVVIIILALIIMFAFVILHSNSTVPEGWLKKLVTAVVVSLIIGLAAALRGKSELERPWEAPRIGQEQLDDRETPETILDQEKLADAQSKHDEI